MANPTVEKLKGVALRFGDKVAVAIASVLFLVFMVLGLTKPTIDTTPEEVERASTNATTNLNRPQDEQTILQKLEGDGMVPQDFVKKVKDLSTRKIDPSSVALVRPFVRTEPGAGLIRGEVKDFLPAPYDLYATAGRGGVSFWKLDQNGDYVPADPTKAATQKVAGGRGAAGGSSSGMFGGSGGGATTKKSDVETQAAKKQVDLAQRKTSQKIAGKAGAPKEEEKKADAPVGDPDYETETRGQRYAAVVGLINHKRLREQYAKALKLEYAQAHPDYVRVEMERQLYDVVRGDWGDWSPVNRDLLEDRPTTLIAATEDETEELTRADARLKPLVGYLPYLAAGYWTGVHHGEVLDDAKMKALEEANDATLAAASNSGGAGSSGGYPGGMMSGGSSGGMMSGGSGGMMSSGESSGYPGGMMSGGSGGMMGSGESSGMMSGGSGGMMGGMGMGAGASGPEVEFKSESDLLMVRGLDLTVEPDSIYRYRVRIVLNNPNFERDDVAPGVDNASQEFAGPWSDPTAKVSVPADVSPYAFSPGRDAGGNTSADQVLFDLAAWDPSTGATVVRQFTVSPGTFVGQTANALVPIEGEEKPKTISVDFNSRQLLCDSLGGLFPVQSLGVVGAPLEAPAVALLLKPDGTLAVRNQAEDRGDDQLRFMTESYRLSISDKQNKKQQGGMMGLGSGGGYPGMGGEGGMMGSGMMSGGMGGGRQ